ncbi:hypothetical protein Bhyg_15544 [Pseudolycoriella hygida]|uniref:Uncharacterized protein n=1 Tax=Pseudolycoriella hygida TaxID=35572 RepID=A0A9Q0RVA6_9DIPT|nr:hypothetical protein Bhyg_15544 [Pseudolycoriella hygida]
MVFVCSHGSHLICYFAFLFCKDTKKMSAKTINIPITTPKLGKIPGELPSIPAEKKINKKELHKHTKTELEELLERQSKLLSNKARLSKLPDKGKRIQDFYDLIVKEIANKDEIDVTSKLFSDLNIATIGSAKLTNMEWNGKFNPDYVDTALDSDDDADENDPIALLAQSRMDKKKLKILRPEKQLITSADLEEIKSFSHDIQKTDSVNSDHSDLEPHALHMCEVESHKQNKPKFLPHKTTISNCHSVENEKGRRQGRRWEITAATPPIIRNSEAQVLSLQESIAIERQQKENMKEIERKHAEERMAEKRKLITNIMSVPEASERNMNLFFTTYRDVVDDDDDSDDPADVDSDDQVHDGDDYNEGGVTIVQYGD